MAKKTAPKKVEYKDTFEFKLFPEYEYTKIQKKRFRLFQGTIKRWRKDINYADSFDNPNEINLLFMLGYDKNMKAYVDRTENNTVVLCADIPKEYLEIYDEYWKLIAKYKGTGDVTPEGKFTEWYYEIRDLNWSHRNDPDVLDWSNKATAGMVQRFDEENEIISNYNRIEKDIWKYYDRFIILDKSIPQRTLPFEKIDSIVKRYFPKGREECGIGIKALGSPDSVRKAATAGIDREDAAKLLGMKEDSYKACSPIIKHCKGLINKQLKEVGYCELFNVWREMQKPPYGWGNESHAAYCLGYAISEASKGMWIYDGCSIFGVEECIYGMVTGIVTGQYGRREYVWLVKNAGQELSPYFIYMFGVEKELGIEGNIKKPIPFFDAAMACCKKAETLTSFPLAIIEPKISEALFGETVGSRNNSVFIPTMGDEKVAEYLNYFTYEKCRELKDKLEHADEIISDIIIKKYNLPVEIEGITIDLPFIRKHCTCQCMPWLHRVDSFWGGLDSLIITQERDVFWYGVWMDRRNGTMECSSPEYKEELEEYDRQYKAYETELSFPKWRKKRHEEQNTAV